MLDSSHYAMLEVKEKVLRYMACQKYLGKNYGAVMLLAGPPGVGKTSIAVSIAKAMGRPCVKMCENITGRCFGCIISTRNTDSIQ